MKKKYYMPEIIEVDMNLSNEIAAGCWIYAGSGKQGGCSNFSVDGPDLCISGWTEGTPSLGAS